jgi:hypothetical protein
VKKKPTHLLSAPKGKRLKVAQFGLGKPKTGGAERVPMGADDGTANTDLA